MSVYGADVAEELGDEALAEAHDLVVRLALGIEIRAALPAAHVEGRERVLEHLLEGEKLQDAQVDRGVKPQPALVGPDGAVHLHPEAAVDVGLAVVVHPGHPEQDDALRFDQPLQDGVAAVLGVPLEHRLHGIEHLTDRLVELLFARIARGHYSQNIQTWKILLFRGMKW